MEKSNASLLASRNSITIEANKNMRMQYLKSLVVVCCFIAATIGIALGQNPSTSSKFVLKNPVGNTITLAPLSSGVTNYSLTLPASVGGAGSLLFASNATGTLGWITTGGIGQVLSINASGLPVWTTPIAGTVSSVGLTVPTGLSVTGSPITTSGTLAITTSLNGVIHGNGSGFTAGNVNLVTEVSGALSTVNGGTGLTSYAAGDILYASAINTLSKLAAGSAGQVLTMVGGVPAWSTLATGGTVTSVGLAMPSIFTVSNSPVTTTGTLTATLNSQSAKMFFAGPVSGANATPTFREITATDIPNLSSLYIVNGTSLQTANYNISGNGTLDGQLQLKGTGTGLTTFQAGAQGSTNINYTLPITGPSNGQILTTTSGGVLSWTNSSAGSVTSVGISVPSGLSVSNSPITTSGTLAITTSLNGVIHGNGSGFTASNVNLATEVTGILGATNGGTGQTSYTVGDILYASSASALSKLAAGTGGQVLTMSGGIPSWTTPGSGGSVTGVGLSMPSIFTVTNSPVTTSGTLTASLNNQVANVVFAGPASGANAPPTFRSLVANDIPSLSGSYIVNGTALQTGNFNISGNGALSGQLKLKGTGTGISSFQSGAQGALDLNYTLPTAAPTANQILTSSGGSSSSLSWTDASSLFAGSYWSLAGNNTANAYNGSTGAFIGTTSAQPLVVATTNTGSAQPIKFLTNNTERAQISATGYVGVGTTNPASILNVTSSEDDDIANDLQLVAYNNTPTNGAEFVTLRARGTIASPGNLLCGDDMGGFKYRGYYNGSFVEAGQIDHAVAGQDVAL
ncbi:MAG: hypothetical protein ABI778_04820, partial [Ignavibacteriota bacterium]